VKFILKLLSKLGSPMKINSRLEEYDTITDSNQPIETPKSAPINFKRSKFEKRLSLIDHL
jgi:hypothetical protein